MTMYRKSATNNHLQRVRPAKFSERYREEDLEILLEGNPDIIAEGEPLLLIGRQLYAGESGTPDLLALDADGNLVIVELKRGRSPRDVIAQALEYAAWAAELDRETIEVLAGDYLRKLPRPVTLAAAWQEAFGQAEDGQISDTVPLDVTLNSRQRIILVLEGRDDRIRKIVNYLRRHGIAINIVEYRFYRTDGGEEFLDIEVVHTAQESTTLQPSESAVIAEWPQAAQEAYRAYKETLMAADDLIQLVPKKSGISFYKQIRDGRVFIGTVAPSQGRMRIWFRRDSLESHVDYPSLEEALKAAVPDNMHLRFTGEYHRRLDFDARAEVGRVAGQLMLEYIVTRFD